MESGASLDEESDLKVSSPLEMASIHYQQFVSRIQEWKRNIQPIPGNLASLNLQSKKSIENVLAWSLPLNWSWYMPSLPLVQLLNRLANNKPFP
jgi:hypothetical protein